MSMQKTRLSKRALRMRFLRARKWGDGTRPWEHETAAYADLGYPHSIT